MKNKQIKKCIQEIQKILINDTEMSIESAKGINNQLKIILLLLEKDENNGSTT